jgi:hypothetical protein
VKADFLTRMPGIGVTATTIVTLLLKRAEMVTTRIVEILVMIFMLKRSRPST